MQVERSVINARGSTQEIYAGLIRDTDNPTTIYGDLGKLRHIVFVTLTIQRPYMATQENFVRVRRIVFVTLTIQRPYMADLGYRTQGNFDVKII